MFKSIRAADAGAVWGDYLHVITTKHAVIQTRLGGYLCAPMTSIVALTSTEIQLLRLLVGSEVELGNHDTKYLLKDLRGIFGPTLFKSIYNKLLVSERSPNPTL